MHLELESFKNTLSYIEDHLFTNLDIKQLAQMSLLNESDFHRFFTYLTGLSFSAYVKERRLSECVKLLQDGTTINELADMCNYSNRSSFHRAFTNFHEITPAQSKEKNSKTNYLPPISLNFIKTGGKRLEVQTIALPDFYINGTQKNHKFDDEDMYSEIQKQWGTFFGNQDMHSLRTNSELTLDFFGEGSAPYFAVAVAPDKDSNVLSYITGFPSTIKISQEVDKLFVPAQSYVVFVSEPYDWRDLINVSNAYKKLRKEIISSYLPNQNWERVSGPELETYFTQDNLTCLKIWIPIKEKANNK